jgi:hypothetical protein
MSSPTENIENKGKEKGTPVPATAIKKNMESTHRQEDRMHVRPIFEHDPLNISRANKVWLRVRRPLDIIPTKVDQSFSLRRRKNCSC